MNVPGFRALQFWCCAIESGLSLNTWLTHPEVANLLDFVGKGSGNVTAVEGGAVPNLSITDQIASLPRLQKEALEGLWREFFKQDPPLRMRKELMVPFLAYRMQEQEFGPLSDKSHRRLCQLARSVEGTSSPISSAKVTLKKLTRRRLPLSWVEQRAQFGFPAQA